MDQTSFSRIGGNASKMRMVVVKAFELAPSGVVTDVFPHSRKMRKPFGINMLTDHNRREDAKPVRKKPETIHLVNAYKLKAGGTGASLLHSIGVYKEDSIDNDSFWGFL
ncbi:MAG: hypothetical protein ACLU80_10655 [Dorea sp.]